MTPQWAWASHQPVIASLLELYKPNFVFESGIGLYSTPLFTDVETYIGVESDAKWIAKVKEVLPELNVIHHNLDINIAERWYNLTSQQKYNIVEFYSELPELLHLNRKGIKLLFVDGYTCTRMYAIKTLWKYFDVIIYHDSRQRKIYGYDHLNVEGFTSYEAVTSIHANTGVFLKEDVGFNAFNAEMKKHIKSFDAKWKINSNTRLYAR